MILPLYLGPCFLVFFLQFIPEDPTKRTRFHTMSTFFILLATFFIMLGPLAWYESFTERQREEQLAKERTFLEEEKRREEAALAKFMREIKEAQVRDEIARLRAERNKLREEAIPRDVAAQIAEVNKQLEELKTTAPQPSELKAMNARNGEMSNASPATPQAPGAPVDDQTRLVLSGLWLGACFFLQRVFEKLFKDKGYALLTVCAAGFLLAFFTANYFLLGGSVTGGLMGSVGERS
jgi:hypothetical protein